MYQQYSRVYYAQEQRFNDRFPLSIVAVLGVIQMLTTFSIIGLEIGHIVNNIRLTNLFVGFWASIPFTILWISMFAAVCCCRRRSCATHALVQNFISFIFAIVLIALNIVFIRRPNDCFFTRDICNRLTWLNDVDLSWSCIFDDYSESCGKTRLALIKAQLAAGVIMATTCLIYVILYGVVVSRASRAGQRQMHAAPDAVMAPVYQQSVPPTMLYGHPPYTISSNPYQPSAPAMIPNYQQVPTHMAPGITNMNYLPPNQESTLYPKIPNDRF
ncbi:unnamed protein product [Rotaria sp. Silwood1]|nr:unnamed protein product [Rotaria sp. Silwood1]CAF1444126.1 unnamed protein product [Rotaria sp. Silwood1]CAF3603036.1 unnamed protein product [Rotaria sp. Silwood1]CAF5099881.1 unnamed protein product [Rotaria sp. Silwood1]